MKIDHIAIHHFGGQGTNNYASTKHLTLADIDNAHRSRWPDFKSQLGYWVGYNFLVWPDGNWTQTRKIGEETAAQKGWNQTCISICLAGNFTRFQQLGTLVDNPTHEQKATLFLLWDMLQRKDPRIVFAPDTQLNLSFYRIHPHRYYQSTSCYGTGLDDEWGVGTILDGYGGELSKWLRLVLFRGKSYFGQAKVRNISLGSSSDRSCEGNINI